MYCKQCGQPVPEDSRFCPNCGAQLAAAPQPPEPELTVGEGVEPLAPPPEPELVIEPAPAPEQPPQEAPAPAPELAPELASEPAPEQPAPAAPRQTPPPAPGGPAGGPPPAQSGPAVSDGANYDLLLKIFASVCAVVCVINTLRQVGYLFTNLRLIVFSQAFEAIPYLPGNLVGLVGYLVLALSLLLLAFRRSRENTDALAFGLAGGGALVLVCRLLGLLVGTLLNAFVLHYFNFRWLLESLGSVLGAVFWLAVCLGGVWGILFAMKQAPDLKTLLKDPAAKFAILMDTLKKGAGEVQQQAGAAAASAKSAYDAHQAQQQAQAAQYQAAQAGGYAVRIPTNRSLIAYILLSIITCGIYSYYFIYTVARDVNMMCREDGEKTGGLLAFILLSFVTCGIYGLYWEYKLGNRLAANAPRYGLTFQENGSSVLLWYLVGLFICGIGPFIAMHILIKNTNALAAAYNAANGL